MNRRRFIYSAALGLMVPAAHAIETRRVVTVLTPSKTRAASAATERLIVSIGESDSNSIAIGFSTGPIYSGAGKWIATESFLLSKVEFYMKRGTAIGTSVVRANVYEGDDTTPTTKVTGSDSTNNYAYDSLSDTDSYVPFYFNNISLTSGDDYWFTLWSSGLSATKVFYLRYDATDTKSVYKSSTEEPSPTWASHDTSSEVKIRIYGY